MRHTQSPEVHEPVSLTGRHPPEEHRLLPLQDRCWCEAFDTCRQTHRELHTQSILAHKQVHSGCVHNSGEGQARKQLGHTRIMRHKHPPAGPRNMGRRTWSLTDTQATLKYR